MEVTPSRIKAIYESVTHVIPGKQPDVLVHGIGIDWLLDGRAVRRVRWA